MDQVLPQPPITPTPPISPDFPPSNPKNHVIAWIVAGAVILTIGIGIGLVAEKYLSPPQISSYEECVKANGNQIQTIYPGTCVTDDGRSFREVLTDEEKKSLQPPDPTANWKTYTNSKYNFTFKYPNNKRVVFDTIGYGVLSKPMVVSISLYSNGFQMPKFNTGFKGELTFSITVVPTPDNDIVNWVKEEGRLTWIYDARVEKSVMDNLPGYTFIKQKKGLNKLVVTNHNNNLFLINAYGESKYVINDVFDQILSTFKFTDTLPKKTEGTFLRRIRGNTVSERVYL